MGAKKGKSFIANIIIIFSAQIVVKLLGMLYRLVITNIEGFGDAGNGFYSAGFQIYTLLLALSSVGIPNAISKLISERVAVSDHIGAKRVFRTALIIFAVVGLVLSALMFTLARPIAHYILNMDGVEYTIAALAPSIFFICISSVFRGYFSGINRMNIMSVSQIIEQVFKSVLTVVFVFAAVDMLPEIMSGWANFATTVATVVSALYLIYKYIRNNDYKGAAFERGVKRNFAKTAKTILVIAIPISLCSVITAFSRIVDTATITRGIETAFAAYIPPHGVAGAEGFVDGIVNPTLEQLGDEAVRLAGMLSKSDTLINLPLALNVAFATALVPTISKFQAVGDKDRAGSYIYFSILTSIALILPCAVGYIMLAEPIYDLIYPNASLGYDLLRFSAIGLIFMALNQTITGALQGMGKVYVPAIALAVGCIVKIILNIVLIAIPQINIYGAVISSIVCQFIVFLIEWISICRLARGRFNLKNMLVKPVICSALMGVLTYISYRGVYQLSSSNAAAVILSIALSAIFYCVLIVLFKVFEKDQLMRIPVLGNIIMFIDKKRMGKNES